MLEGWGAWWATLAIAANPSDAPQRPPRPIFGHSQQITARKLPQAQPEGQAARPSFQRPAARAVPAKPIADSALTGQPIHSRERAFRVPFRVNAAERPRLQEVQLYFSTDRGNSWKQYSAAKPDDDAFTFAARNDGEYWFAVRTLSREQQHYPPSLDGVEPGLRVVVDTTPPEVSLRALETPNDQIGVQWDIVDDFIDLSSLRAEFRPDDSQSWFPVNIEAKARGQAAWRPGVRGRIIIRLRVLDKAGNEGVREIALGSGTTGVPAIGDARPNPAIPLAQPSNGTSTGSAGRNGFRVPDRPNVGGEWGSVNPPPPTAALDQTPATGTRFGAQANDQAAVAPSQGRLVPFDRNERSSAAQPDNRGRSAGPTNVELVNSTRFGISYDIVDKGKSGISSVKLFFTYDGRTWEEYGEDEDKTSPFPVKVNGEGTYGFSIIVKSGAGMGDEVPAPGDPPQKWVEVDVTPPEVKIGVPEVGKGAAAGVLGIAWQAQDRNPAARGINLSYSESSNGPWKPIATGIENTGRYQWVIPPEAPYKFYIRVEAKDKAGNVGRAETDSPTIVDLARPRAKIVGVESAGSPFKTPELDR